MYSFTSHRRQPFRLLILLARVWFLTLLCTLSLGDRLPNVFSASIKHGVSTIPLTISGIVFDDYNQNGIQDAGEPGINGIVVTASDASNAVIGTQTTSTSSGVLGRYQMSLPPQPDGVRIQFSNFGKTSTLPQLIGYQPSARGSGMTVNYGSNVVAGGATVAFVDGSQSSASVNLGIERPEDYCQNNPQVATSCYIIGNQKATQMVAVKFPYQSSVSSPHPQSLGTAPQLGTTWGLAYRRSSDSLFAAAYIKRHAGLKPGGSTGAIYLIQKANTGSPTVQSTPFVDLNTIFGANTAGANPHDQNNYALDAATYDAVGKVGLGGLALSGDEQTLYTVNLADQQLYQIPLGAPPGTPTPGTVTRTPLPVPSNCVSTDFRPFAVSWYQNSVYVGAVCSAESTVTNKDPIGNSSKLWAYILQYVPGSGFLANPAFQFPLNNPRHCVTSTFDPRCTAAASANWRPWHPGYAETVRTDFPTYPQPMLASIAFEHGDFILGMRDRYGDQLGFHELTPDSKHRVGGITAGDILRACLNTPGDLSSGWTLENNASCGGTRTAGSGNGQGPGGGEYYYQDTFLPFHDHVGMGSVLHIPGLSTLMAGVFDPEIVNTGGIRTFDTTTGIKTSAYQIYDPSIPNEFNKANGLGSLVALCQSAPVTIGDRVWFDRNGDGIQEPGEPGIGGVTVHLYKQDGKTLVATTTTDASGAYAFSISPYQSYVIKLDNVQDYQTGALVGFQLTAANQDAVTHTTDSKAVLTDLTQPILPTLLPPLRHLTTSLNAPEVLVAPHIPGQNDNALGIGFKQSLVPHAIIGTVFDDYNQNGLRDSREPGINGVVVSAYNSTGALLGSTTSGSTGVLGRYKLPMPLGVNDVRVQFTNFGSGATLPWLQGFEPSNHQGGTPVAFVHNASSGATVNLGIERPEEYCQNNPNVATSCYIMGNQTNAANHVVVLFPYDRRGNALRPSPLATAPQVGTTWSLAYRRSSDSLFAASYIKREAGLAPGSTPGSIFLIQGADTSSSTKGTLFVDLNRVFGNNPAGTDPHQPANYPADPNAYDAVGKVGLGGMALSADERTLYAMNLADRRLYRIDLGSAPAAPKLGTITRTDLPPISGCLASDVRPFAVTEHWGDIYVGVVCSAASTVSSAHPDGDASKLQAYVLRYDPNSGFASQPVFSFPLNYPRRCGNNAYTLSYANCRHLFSANWNPWHATFVMVSPNPYPVYPQPMLTSITFDNGDLILGLRDRYGDQVGWQVPPPSGGSRVNGMTAGDILRACQRTSGDPMGGWTLENDARCGQIQTAGKDTGPGLGPGNGKYYFQDSFHPYHDYVGLGGVEQVPGFATVMASIFDPVETVNAGGARAFDDTLGTVDHGYEVYLAGAPGTFGKTSGIGTVKALCHSAPIEIGHRVWVDSNGNGIQDANEPGLAGVTVNLYAADGVTLLRSTVTDSDGTYSFMIQPYTRYVIKLDNPTNYGSSGPLFGTHLTQANQDQQTFDTDSKATLPSPLVPIGSGNYPQILVSAHTPGQNDEAQDSGFTMVV